VREIVAIARKIGTRTSGATMVEYGLLLGLIVLVCVGVAAILGQNVLPLYNTPAL